MTARILLIRHAAHDRLGRVLCGRMPGVELNAAGHEQSARLARHLAAAGLTALHTSPQPRARQTAAPIAAACALPLAIEPALDEIDYGAWTGLAFADLAADPAWIAWNTQRGRHRPPGGESMVDARRRMRDWLHAIAAGTTVAAVSHADVIKAAVCLALDLPLDRHASFDVDPASITTLVAGNWGMKLTSLNVAP